MARPIDIHLPGGVILLTPPGVLPARTAHLHGVACDTRILQRLRGDARALAELRREWWMLGLPHDPRHAAAPTLLATLEQAVARRRLDLHWLPHDTGQEVTQTHRPRATLPKAVGDWTAGEKVAEALRRATTAKAMRRELDALMRQLLDPQNLVYALPLILLMAVPGGGAALVALAYLTAGIQGIHAMLEFGRATIGLLRATDERAVDEAAELYAHALVTLGTAFLARFLGRLATRGAAAMGRAEAARVKPAGSGQRPPAGPPPAPRHSATVGAATVAAKPVGTTVYRSDGRAPGEIFDKGFQPRGSKTDLIDYVDNDAKDSAFVGTSKSKDIYKSGFYGGDDRFLYQIDGRKVQGIDVNAVHPANTFAAEQEIAIMGGVPRDAIVSARKVMANGTLGPVIPNPGYKGGP